MEGQFGRMLLKYSAYNKFTYKKIVWNVKALQYDPYLAVLSQLCANGFFPFGGNDLDSSDAGCKVAGTCTCRYLRGYPSTLGDLYCLIVSNFCFSALCLRFSCRVQVSSDPRRSHQTFL